MTYLLDANTFMEASRLYYGFDFAPGFWTWLRNSGNSGRVHSISQVKSEITAGTGDLVSWANAMPDDDFWLPDTAESIAHVSVLSAWADDPARPYRDYAVAEFLGSADLRLIAQAQAIGATLVTREKPEPLSKKRVKIPDVCNAHGVQWSEPFAVYKKLGLCLR